ncbi:hypothetical protein SOJ00_08975 [Pseudomonas paraeruginosa]|uniref:hypothetical protein n=2 Tax=Pseudomonas TaxID=286 RepID=UPI002A76420F|nr:hypothetical protein [Pseudomonas paraeruginosa]MDY1574669.1 hypothetical protein [Pseudomonas paraeruginosa]
MTEAPPHAGLFYLEIAMNNTPNLTKLRTLINENLRTQIGSRDVTYISSGHTLGDASAKQSHCIFARRGCGKTLLLHHSRRTLPTDVKAIYINCEDFKHHSFPNVLIEIIDNVFKELENNLSKWFGRKAKLRQIICDLRQDLGNLKDGPDESDIEITIKDGSESETQKGVKLSAPEGIDVGIHADRLIKSRGDTERKYRYNESKLRNLNHRLPDYKSKIREFFNVSGKASSVFIQLDDFYQLSKSDQPFVADYVHRLCKDTNLKFKIATLKHNSILYIERQGQPIGIQERHDYQPINIDFTFENFTRTRDQNKGIFLRYAELAGVNPGDFDTLFKGKGFDRLIMAGGGVPRDCLSFFLEALERVRSQDPEGRIGKDEVRFLSRETFDRRIDELKQDSEGQDQDTLLRGIHAIREFCLTKKSNVFLIAEKDLQNDNEFKILLYRLLDYRIIHHVANSLTHKSKSATNFQAFAIDIGCYAYMRNLQGRFDEIDFTEKNSKEKMRSAPIFESGEFRRIWLDSQKKPIEEALKEQEAR